MDQKRVRNSSACEVCRKRRGKCSGSAPCTYCAEHHQLCVFSAAIKKRGPASKKQKGIYNFTEGAFVLHQTPDAEYKYMGEYLNHFFFLPPLNQDGIHNPTTPAHHMMRFVLLSHMSRSFGAIARSEEFITTARQISGQLYDDPSYDSGVAFMLLADICLANGDSRASHYASVAWNHAKGLARNDWSNIHLQVLAFVMSNMLDNSLTPEQKQQQLYKYASQLLDADVLTTVISGLMLKTGAVGLILNGTSCKEAGLLSCLKDVTVDHVAETMNDLDKLEYYVQNTPPIQKWVLLLFAKLFRTMLFIQQGSFSEASQAARDMVEISNRAEIRNIVNNELFLPVIMPNLATLGSLKKVVIELYHFTQHLESQYAAENNSSGPNPTPGPNPTNGPNFNNSDAAMLDYTLKQEAPDTPTILPTYSPTQPISPFPSQPSPPSFSSQPLSSQRFTEINDLTLQQVPQTTTTTATTITGRPKSSKAVPIAKQPDMLAPTQQPTLQLTLQRLFQQQGLNSRSPFASVALPPSACAVPQGPPPLPSATPIPLASFFSPSSSSPSSSISPSFSPNGSPSVSPPQIIPEISVEDDFLWWQSTDKVEDLWNQAIVG